MHHLEKRHKLNLFLVILIFVTLILGCEDTSKPPSSQATPTPPNFKYSVWVRDRDTNNLLGQVKVYLAVGNQTIAQDLTDESGQASFDVEGSYMGKDARFYAEHRNYYPNDITVKLGKENRNIIVMTNRSLPKIDPDPPKPTSAEKQKVESQPLPVKENMESISVNGEKTGKITENQTKDFQFNADKNDPVLFTASCDINIGKTYEFYVQIFDSQGKGLKQVFLICGNDVKELPFSPPDTGNYILRVKGNQFYGNYKIYFNSNN